MKNSKNNHQSEMYIFMKKHVYYNYHLQEQLWEIFEYICSK